MKKTNLITLLLTTILSIFIISGFAFADDTWNGTDTTGNATRTGNVGIGTTNPGAKLDIQGQVIGGFGATTTGGILDWNDPSNARSGSGYTLLLGNASNGPGPLRYFHPFSFEYSSKNGSGNMLQLALPYYTNYDDGGSNIWMRARYEGNWTGWRKVLSEDANGNVGIGTTNPGALLDIYKEDASLPATLRIRSKDTSTGAPPFSAIEMRSSSTTDTSTDFQAGRIIAGYDSGSFSSARLSLQSVDSTGSYINTLNIKNGSVGIGTTSPATPIHVYKQNTVSRTSITDIISLDSIAYGVGGIGYDGFGTGLVFRGRTYQNATVRPLSRIASIQRGHSINDYGNAIVFQTIPTSSGSETPIERMRIEYNGNIGIGTTTPDYKLDVKGTIRAEEVKVETGWSDFVFEEAYNLPTLHQVESFIKENKHLPDIPSAKQVEEEGLSMAEMMAKQMQKIEELTLYLIEMKKENDVLKERVAILEKK